MNYNKLVAIIAIHIGCITVINPLTMQEAVDFSLKNRPSIQALEHLLAAKRHNEKLAWSGYYPLISFSSAWSQARHKSYPQASMELNAQQLIYDPAGPQVQAALEHTRTDQLTFQQEQLKLSAQFAVETTYLDCWQLQQQYDSIVTLNSAAKKLLAQKDLQHTTELISKNDWLTAIERSSNNLASVDQYFDMLRQNEKMLSFLLGYKQPLHLRPNIKNTTTLSWPEQNIILKKLTHYKMLAVQHRPEIKQAEKKVEETAELYRIASRSQLPILSLNAQVYHNGLVLPGLGAIPMADRGGHSIGAAVTWNIFDQAKGSIATSQAQAQKLADELNKQEVINQVRNDVEKTYYDVSQSLTQLRAMYARYVRSKNEFLLRTQEFKTKLLGPVEYEQAKSTWEQASFDWITQKVTVGKKYRELVFKCGYPQQNML